MKNTVLMIAGPLISIFIAWLSSRKKRNVAAWMEERKIVTKRKVDTGVKLCGVCNRPMIRRTRHTGKKAGVFFWVCSHFPHCRKVEECE